MTKPTRMGDVRLQPTTYIPTQTSQKMGENHERRTDAQPQPRPSPELRAERAWRPTTDKHAAEPRVAASGPFPQSDSWTKPRSVDG